MGEGRDAHDDGPQIILPAPASPERTAERLRRAEAVVREAGFPWARVEEREETLLIRMASVHLPRLREEELREGLVARLKALGYAFVAIELPPEEEAV